MSETKLDGVAELARSISQFQAAAQTMDAAARNMSDAADKMRTVLRDFDYTVGCHQRFMEGWLQNLRNSLEEILPIPGEPVIVKLAKEEIVDLEAYTEGLPTPLSDRPTMPSPTCVECLCDQS